MEDNMFCLCKTFKMKIKKKKFCFLNLRIFLYSRLSGTCYSQNFKNFQTNVRKIQSQLLLFCTLWKNLSLTQNMNNTCHYSKPWFKRTWISKRLHKVLKMSMYNMYLIRLWNTMNAKFWLIFLTLKFWKCHTAHATVAALED